MLHLLPHITAYHITPHNMEIRKVDSPYETLLIEFFPSRHHEYSHGSSSFVNDVFHGVVKGGK